MSTRRRFLTRLSTVAAAGMSAPFVERAAAQGAPAALTFDRNVPVVKTTAGSLRGYLRNGIHTFKGIQYGESTAGKNRFMPPVKKTAWTGVKPAIAYGYASPQIHGKDWDNPDSHFLFNYEFGMMDENCLQLNVWTPGVGSGKRPVLVWIHGGGYSNGSSFEMLPYDGENISRRGDIVFVSVNHRLNVLGYLDMSSVGGPAFESSANVGMLDLVSALEWVRDNIAQFGGDPANVTICGHSGGGGKVLSLMAMPMAKGLFHKAIVQSGALGALRGPEVSRQVGEGLAKKLGITGQDIGKLQELPYDQLMAAATTVIGDLTRQSGAGGGGPLGRFGWSPTADGKIITGSPAKSGGQELSPDIPVLVGYTNWELSSPAFDASADGITEANARQRLERTFPGKSSALIDLFRSEYPSAPWPAIYSMVASLTFKNGSVNEMERRASIGKAPVWGYRFDWNSDVQDGRLGPYHSLEIAFTFDNTARWDSATGGGERPQALASRMSEAWISFARNGNPNHRGLPAWPAYTASDKAVMVFDDACEVRKGPDEKARKILG